MVRLPLDKSLAKCFTILSLKNLIDGGYTKFNNYRNFLNTYPEKELSDDVLACRDILNIWEISDEIHVRDFRSLYIALSYFCDKNNIKKKITKGAELTKRKLDPDSSQWESAKILVGEKSDSMLYHVDLARESIKLFNDEKYLQFDRTIAKQFNYFINKIQKRKPKLRIDSAEDIPLAYIFGEITMKEIKSKYKTLEHHETNRFKEIEYMKTNSSNFSKDHRCAMARAMKDWSGDGAYRDGSYKPTKSFPLFYDYLREIYNLYHIW